MYVFAFFSINILSLYYNLHSVHVIVYDLLLDSIL